jgi:hypothetical protein
VTAATTTPAPADRGIVDPVAGWICSVLLLVAPVRERDTTNAIHLLRCQECARRISIWGRN